MGLDMGERVGAVALVLVWFYASHCMGQTTPRSLVTPAYYNSLMSAVATACAGKSFYTYSSFITAAERATGFGTAGSDVTRRREIAAFFGNVMHETGGLCYVRERSPQSDYCDPSYTQWPCAPGKRYFGRGPLQLSWNYNYGVAGRALGFDGMNNPDIVGQNALTSFRAAFWFWMNNCHNAMVSGEGFGATIRSINSGECNGGNPGQVNSRINYYRRFCKDFGVDPGPGLSC